MTTDPRLIGAEKWLISRYYLKKAAEGLAPDFLAAIDVYDPLRQPVDGDVVERMLTFMAEVGRAREMTAGPILAVFADGSTRPVLSGPDSVPVTAATAGGIILDLQDRISELEGLTAPPAAPAQSSGADTGAQATGDAHKAPVAALTALREAFPPGAERVILSGVALEAVVDAIGVLEDATTAEDKFLDGALREATARPAIEGAIIMLITNPPGSCPEEFDIASAQKEISYLRDRVNGLEEQNKALRMGLVDAAMVEAMARYGWEAARPYSPWNDPFDGPSAPEREMILVQMRGALTALAAMGGGDNHA